MARVEQPSVARMYDFFLGGAHNFAVDRKVAQAAIRVYPSLVAAARANRSFLGRAVRFLARQGIDQFLDLGSGIPTSGNVHEVAERINPEARVVYVDRESVAVAHGASMLADHRRAVAIEADLRQPAEVLDNPAVRGLLDRDRPVALLTVAVLHFVPESDDPVGILARYRDAFPAGSYLVLSHGSAEGLPRTALRAGEDLQAIYSDTTTPIAARSRARIAELFDGYELIDPGVVPVMDWRPDPGKPEEPDPWISIYAGLGRRP
ncbi:MAG TPA: SAM-dependent methyltransferase [Mycobacteriales bacterium]|nr:SAM-dependent methyltransferase [Mycobacteriales bacterium]